MDIPLKKTPPEILLRVLSYFDYFLEFFSTQPPSELPTPTGVQQILDGAAPLSQVEQLAQLAHIMGGGSNDGRVGPSTGFLDDMFPPNDTMMPPGMIPPSDPTAMMPPSSQPGSRRPSSGGLW